MMVLCVIALQFIVMFLLVLDVLIGSCFVKKVYSDSCPVPEGRGASGRLQPERGPTAGRDGH